jgi:hypothetical protein
LAGVADLEAVGQGVTPGRRDHAHHRLEQLGGRHRHRDRLIGTDIAPITHQDQVVTGGQHGLEQRLTHLPAGIPVPELRTDRGQVIAGGPRRSECRLVHAEEADHSEGDPPERPHRGDGDPATEEIGPSHLGVEAFVEYFPHVGEVERGR